MEGPGAKRNGGVEFAGPDRTGWSLRGAGGRRGIRSEGRLEGVGCGSGRVGVPKGTKARRLRWVGD